jgi:hypothetical protein
MVTLLAHYEGRLEPHESVMEGLRRALGYDRPTDLDAALLNDQQLQSTLSRGMGSVACARWAQSRQHDLRAIRLVCSKAG